MQLLLLIVLHLCSCLASPLHHLVARTTQDVSFPRATSPSSSATDAIPPLVVAAYDNTFFRKTNGNYVLPFPLCKGKPLVTAARFAGQIVYDSVRECAARAFDDHEHHRPHSAIKIKATPVQPKYKAFAVTKSWNEDYICIPLKYTDMVERWKPTPEVVESHIYVLEKCPQFTATQSDIIKAKGKTKAE